MVSVKPIKDFEGKYSITIDGRVFSELRTDKLGRIQGGHFLKPKQDKYGYLVVSLTTVNRKAQHKTIHRLVAEAFIENPNQHPTINHKDGNKENNHSSNLEWVSWKENTQHAWRLGLCKPYDRTKEYNRQGIIDSNKRRRKCGI